MSEILDVSEARAGAVNRAAGFLRRGELVVLPTDTVYGLAADAFSKAGTGRLFRAKRRSRTLPLPVLVRNPKQLNGLVTTVPEAAERLMAAYWPGPLTIVVPADPNLVWDIGRAEGTVAVRMPLDDVALDLIRAVGPLAVTSANRSGQPAATTAEQARGQLGDSVALYLDDGPRSDHQPSAIVDLTRDRPHLLREGSHDSARLLAVARGELDPIDALQEASSPSEDGRDDRRGEV